MKQNAPDILQLRLLKHLYGMTVFALSICFTAAGLAAYAQRDGGSMDMHQDMDNYIERAMRKNPSLNREQFRAAAEQMAETTKYRRVGAPLLIGSAFGFAAWNIRKKIRSAEAERSPKP